MLQKATLDFIAKLTKNNNKEWFDTNRKSYEAAKKDFEDFIEAVHEELTKLEPAIAEHKSKESIFRIFRDVRFGKNKTPYKDHFGAYMSRGGRKAPDAGYYIHLMPGKSFLAGGIWMPESAVLKKLRQEIDYDLREFKSIINKPAFKKLFPKLEGEQLKTVPQGYNADNAAIEYLKMKSFIVSTPISDKDIFGKDNVENVMKIFTQMKPLVDFLNRALD